MFVFNMGDSEEINIAGSSGLLTKKCPRITMDARAGIARHWIIAFYKPPIRLMHCISAKIMDK